MSSSMCQYHPTILLVFPVALADLCWCSLKCLETARKSYGTDEDMIVIDRKSTFASASWWYVLPWSQRTSGLSNYRLWASFHFKLDNKFQQQIVQCGLLKSWKLGCTRVSLRHFPELKSIGSFKAGRVVFSYSAPPWSYKLKVRSKLHYKGCISIYAQHKYII